jgi:hypothetical protein
VRDLAASLYNTAGKIIPADKVLLNRQGNNVNQCYIISILTFLNNQLKKMYTMKYLPNISSPS